MNQLDSFIKGGISSIFANPEYQTIICTEGANALRPLFPEIPELDDEEDSEKA